MDLKNQQCQPCSGDARPLAAADYDSYLAQLPGWKVTDIDGIPTLVKTYEFTNYTQCLAFVHEVGTLAEKENHHPEMTVSYGKVRVSWWTHTIKGLHINDFILAARSDELAETFYV